MNKKILIPVFFVLILSTSVFAFSFHEWYNNANKNLINKEDNDSNKEKNCPQRMPPEPGWCVDGKIISGGVDPTTKCKLPPICSYKTKKTNCEKNSGACIFWQDNCMEGYADANYACKTRSEKCCAPCAKEGENLQVMIRQNKICCEGLENSTSKGLFGFKRITCVKKLECRDSDKGKDYYQKGITVPVAGRKENKTDFCIDSTTLSEFYCEEDVLKEETYKCPDSCKNGQCVKQEVNCPQLTPPQPGWCDNGTIVSGGVDPNTGCKLPPICSYENETEKNETEAKKTEKNETACIDSDGGLDYTKKGETTGKAAIAGTASIKRTDSCSKYSVERLIEYYCKDNGVISSYIYTCPNGCKDGVCIT